MELLEKIPNQFNRNALFRAPLMPAAVFTVASLVFSSFLVAIFPGISANLLLFTPLVFIGWYLVGLASTLLLGVILLPLLPDEIPVISSLNSSRFGRILLAFAALGIAAFSMFGLSVWTIIFVLMCLGEYTSRLPHKREKQVKKKGLFV